MGPRQYVFTSESVSEGHPDKVRDYIADSILDAHLAQDPQARVACEVPCKGSNVILAGEISSAVAIDYGRIAQDAIREIGDTDVTQEFLPTGEPKLAEQFEEHRLDLDKRLRRMTPEELAAEDDFFAEICRQVEEG